MSLHIGVSRATTNRDLKTFSSRRLVLVIVSEVWMSTRRIASYFVVTHQHNYIKQLTLPKRTRVTNQGLQTKDYEPEPRDRVKHKH